MKRHALVIPFCAVTIVATCYMLFLLLSFRWAGADTILPPDAGPAAASDEEATAGSSRSPAESRAAAAGTGHGAAEG